MDELLRGIVANPSESMPVELKRWLDLADRSHKAKIIKALSGESERSSSSTFCWSQHE
jgi:hypothetical protein